MVVQIFIESVQIKIQIIDVAQFGNGITLRNFTIEIEIQKIAGLANIKNDRLIIDHDNLPE